MCRLFGFRSVINSRVHKSLILAENALSVQSKKHPDGWGIAYYIGNSPHVIKAASTAMLDNHFEKVAGVVSSKTVIAHIRRASVGGHSVFNTHPFQFGKWVFAHNGHIKNFAQFRGVLQSKIAPKLGRFMLGETDSELLFFLLLTNMARRVDLNRSGCDLNELQCACLETIEELQSVVGPFCELDNGRLDENYFTFLISDGLTLLGFQGGKDLHYSTHKVSCSEKLDCAYYSVECEQPTQSGFVNHLLFSSELIEGENVWTKMSPGQFVGANWRMRFKVF